MASGFSFDDIEFWVGAGENRAALVIDWVENSAEPPALAWGYRWNGAAMGGDMLTAIVAADQRLFAKLGSSGAVYGLGYDANDDGQFAIDDGTSFDANGIALSGPADLAESVDPADYYAEGWFTGLWHYGIASVNPYDGGSWSSSGGGMAGRVLTDGAWDSWTFTPSFDFAAFAENPAAAQPPSLPGDHSGDGVVDAADYVAWRKAGGLPGGYDAWRGHFGTTVAAGGSAAVSTIGGSPVASVPEPNLQTLFAILWFLKRPRLRRRTLIDANPAVKRA